MKSFKLLPAGLEHESDIRRLWQSSFHDGDEYLDLFFSHWFRPGRVLLIEAEGYIAGMMALFDAEIKDVQVAYIYAMCIDEPLRKNGLGLGFINEASDYLRCHGYSAMALVPANAGLFNFYSKAGFKTCFGAKTAVQQLGASKKCSLHSIGSGEYALRRKQLLDRSGIAALNYGAEFTEYQLQAARLYGGGMFAVENGIALVEIAGNELFIKEIMCDDISAASSAIMREYGVKSCRVRTPGHNPFGMLKPLIAMNSFENGWLGFVMD